MIDRWIEASCAAHPTDHPLANHLNAAHPTPTHATQANTLLSGLGFENSGVAVAHALHNGLTAAPGTHAFMHGEKVAFGLHAQLALEGRPAAEVDAVLTFCEAVGLPVTLAQVGVDASDAEVVAAVAARTVKPGETSHNEPFEVTAEMVADAMRSADARGRRFRGRAPYS